MDCKCAAVVSTGPTPSTLDTYLRQHSIRSVGRVVACFKGGMDGFSPHCEIKIRFHRLTSNLKLEPTTFVVWKVTRKQRTVRSRNYILRLIVLLIVVSRLATTHSDSGRLVCQKLISEAELQKLVYVKLVALDLTYHFVESCVASIFIPTRRALWRF